VSYPVTLRPRAENDIRTIFEWYESQQRTLGEAFLVDLRLTMDRIGRFPESSPVVRKRVRRAFVTKFPYLVFYIVDATRVVVLAVLHTSRDPAVWPRG
jgi:toxin ParE1/3/4